MSFLDVVRYRLRVAFRPASYARELDEEVRHHLELDAIDARSAAGGALSAEAARRRARREFGNITYSIEERRMIAGLAVLDSARQDIQFVLRLLRRRAGFAAVTVATIALGIGAATSIFSVADAVLFQPLALPHSERLTAIWLTRPRWKMNPVLATRWDRGSVSLPLFRDWQATQTSFDAVAVWVAGEAVVGGPDSPQEVTVVRASAALLRVLGIRPELGAWFSAADDAVGGAPVAVLSHETWAARFGSDPQIVGRAVDIDGVRYTIAGVVPPGLSLDRSGAVVACWVPAGRDSSDASDRSSFAFQLLGRRKATVPLPAAAAEAERFFRSVPGDNTVKGAALASLHADQTRTVRRPLLTLLAAAGLLLLIACINVATLLMGEAVSREHELRTRAALGASRPRLFRQLLTESVVLAGGGALAGAVLAFVATKLIVRAAPPTIPGLADVRVDAHVLAVALVVAAGTGVLFGLAPALSLTRSARTFGAGGSRHSARGRGRGQRILIACEVALSIVLLVGAGLLVRSFNNLSSVGFRPADLLAVTVRLPRLPNGDSVRVRALYDDILQRLRAIPGVVSAAATTTPPFSSGSSSASFEMEGHPPSVGAPPLVAQRRATTPEFFATVEIPIVAGRAYSHADGGGAPLVVVVSHALARREWPTESAIGKRIKFAEQWRTVIGVAGDIETERPSPEPPETIYAPLSQLMLRGAPAVLVRTLPASVNTVANIRRAVHDVEADVSVSRVDEMTDLVAASLADDRLRTVLISLFAAISALLSAVGTYGVAAAAASRRTREMAIRVAVGATSGSIAKLIVGEGARGVMLGAVAGSGLAWLGAQSLSPYLFGVRLVDPSVYASVGLLLAITTIVATWIPARRATRVRLVDTLTAE
ncbi:MAG: ADOP family duplicated permease [Gemmatimonadota bacterium]|nr:ADOP family duplicated permease [Gemmatimonadota bacterium]